MKQHAFVLAVYPTVKGYSFVLFEGPESPFDWGTRDIRDTRKNASTLEDISRLVERYHPTVLILEDVRGHRPRRSMRIKRLYRALYAFARAAEVHVKTYGRESIKQCFSTVGAATKYEVAMAIARRIPAFKHRLPPLRKIWMSEDPRQSLFDAAALGLTYYCLDGDEAHRISLDGDGLCRSG